MTEMSESSRWEKEIEQFNEVLADTKGQAIVIVGPAGSGKSALLGNMVLRGKKGEKFRCDGNIYPVGPSDHPNSILQKIGSEYGGKMVYMGAKFVLERLSRSVEEFGDLHRRVVGVDAAPTQPAGFKREWLEIIPQLPDKVKFIFTQRPDGILATNKQFMGLPNVVRIDIKIPQLSDDRLEGKYKDEYQLSAAFVSFLERKKGYPISSMIMQESDRGIDGGVDRGIRQDLAIVDHEKQKQLAVVEFGLNEDNSTIQMGWQHFMYVNRNAAYTDIEGYIVFPDEAGLGEEFSVIKLNKDIKKYESLLCEDFPAYEDLRGKKETETEDSEDEGSDDEKVNDFKSKLTDIGKELFDKLIELIRSEPSFVIKAKKPSYINVEIRKPKRVAFQIHRVVDDYSQLGLAIAGWDEDDPEIKNKYSIVRRDIKRLSGLHDTTQENYWLRGKIQSQAKRNFPPYEAKVYIIDPGMQEDEDAWEELKELLQYAKEVTGRGKINIPLPIVKTETWGF